jgi:flagellar biosynthesis protein
MAKRSAAALRYDPTKDAAPQLVTAGEGRHAERILALAVENGIPVREDPLLAEALAQLAGGAEIPPELYIAVAEALVWAWEADRDAEKLSVARGGAGN